MNKIIFLLVALSVFPLLSQAQNNTENKHWSVGYYSFNNELGISHISSKDFYTELRFTSNRNDRPEVSLILRQLSKIDEENNLKLSYGIGGSISIYGGDSNEYFKVPIYLVKENVITKNLNFMLGFEMKTDFNFYRILPGVGVSFKL